MSDTDEIPEWARKMARERLCGKYVGDNDATCPQLTCIRWRDHEGPCDNVRGDDGPKVKP